MKKIFRMVMALTLVCGALSITGCTDYEEDINSINDRLDALETGTIASMDEQIKTMSSAIDQANSLISTLQDNVDALESADETIHGLIDDLNGNIETIEGNITTINGQIADLETDLEKQISDAVAELEAADDANATKIDQLASDLAEAKEELQAAIESGDKTNADAISALSEKVESYYAELKKAIDDANTSNKAEFDAINDKIEALQADLKEQTDALAALTETVATLSGKVTALEGLTAGLPALEEKVDSIEQNYLSKADAADLYATAESVLALQEELGKVSERLTAIEELDIANRLSELEANYKDIIEITVPDLEGKISAAQTAADKAQQSADAAQEYAEGVFGDLEALKNALGAYAEAGALEAKIEELEAKNAALAEKDTELEGLIEDLDASVASELAVIKGNIQTVQDNLDKAVADINAAKLDKEEFGEYFSNALMADIAKADGQVNTAINEAVSAAANDLQQKIDGINADIVEINTALGDLTTAIKDLEDKLEGMIQSISFVPEFTDNMATSYYYTVHDKALYDNILVKATFEISPKEYASKLYTSEEGTPSNVSLAIVPVKTRAAQAVTEITADAITVTKGSSLGQVDVEVELPYDDWKDVSDFSIALKVTEYEADAESGDAVVGTYVSSEYVGVKNIREDIADMYVYAKEETDGKFTEWSGVKSYTLDWYNAPATKALYEGYDMYLKVSDSEYRTVADFAEEFHIDPAAITPVFSFTGAYEDKTGSEIDAEDAHISLTEVDQVSPEGAKDVEGAMKEASDKMKQYVGETATATVTFTVDDLTVGNESGYVANYVIGKHRTDATLYTRTDDRIDWTYEFAKEYSYTTGANAAYDRQWAVEEAGFEGISEDYNIVEIISDNQYTWTQKVYAGTAEEVAAGTATVVNERSNEAGNENKLYQSISAKTGQIENIVSFVIGSYGDCFPEFAEGETPAEQTYTFVTTYNVSDYEELVITYEFVLGPKPSVVEIDLNELLNGGNPYLLPVSSEVITLPLGDNLYEEIVDYVNALYDGVQYFADADEFNEFFTATGSMQSNTTRVMSADRIPETGTAVKVTDKVNEPFAGPMSAAWTALRMFTRSDNDMIRVSSSNVDKLTDKFSFTTTLDAWYGVEYIFTANAEFDETGYTLKYAPEFVDEDQAVPTAYIDGRIIDAAYTLNTVDLANYFEIDNRNNGNDALTVDFKIVDPTSVAADEAIPTIENSTVTVTDNRIPSDKVEWGESHLREITVEATLKVGVFAADTKQLKLLVYDPITVVNEVSDIEVLKYPDVEATADLWKDFVIYGRYRTENGHAVNDPINLVNPEETFGNMFHYHDGEFSDFYGKTTYGIDYEFDSEVVSIKVGDIDRTDNYVQGTDYEFSNGQLVFKAENADLVNGVTFTVKYNLNYKLDNYETKTITVNVTFKNAYQQ